MLPDNKLYIIQINLVFWCPVFRYQQAYVVALLYFPFLRCVCVRTISQIYRMEYQFAYKSHGCQLKLMPSGYTTVEWYLFIHSITTIA